MEKNVFQVASWFENLWRHGIQPEPHRYWLWPLNKDTDAVFTCMHLIQNDEFSGLSALSTYYTCLFGPESDSSTLSDIDEDQWREAVSIMKGIPGSEFISLFPLDKDSQWLHMLKNSLQKNGFLTKQYFYFGNWYHIVPAEGFQSYWSNRPSALRNTVVRGRRRLDTTGVWRIDIHTPLTTEALGGLENAITAYETVYALSWKKSEPHKNFLPELMRIAMKQGWLRLGLLWLNERPIAAQLWLVSNKKANIYKLAYVKGVEKFSAGSILTSSLMQYTMDIDKVREVDYLSGDDAYKAAWMDFRRERVGLLALDLYKLKGWKMAYIYLFRKIKRRSLEMVF